VERRGRILLNASLDSLDVSPITSTAGWSAGHPNVTQERIFDV
jgi:hypothetical protein